MSKRSAFDVSGSGASNIRLDNVTTMWLEAGPRERYLLLEDPETGDVLMPLIYMKHILEANYSRKLASLKNRLVTVPPGHALHVQEGLLYWQWAFESPHSVKQIVRKEIGDATPQGHLRLVLLPIVYNALVTREDLRATPLFRALHRVMRASSYWPLLRLPSSDVMRQCDADTGIAHPFPNAFTQVLFAGPTSLDSTAIKYMFMFRSHEEMEASKRTRTTGIAAQDNGVLNATLARQPTHGSLPLMPSPSVAAMMGARAGSLGTFPDSATASDNNGIDNTTNTNNAGASNPNSNHDNHLAAGPGMDPDVSAMAPQQPPPVSQGFIDAIMGTSNAGGGVTRAALPPDLRMLVDAKFNDLLGEVNRLKMGMVQLYSVITNVASHHGAAAMAQSPAAAAVSPLLGLAAGLGPATAHAHNRAQHPQSSVLPSHKGDFHGGTPAAPPPAEVHCDGTHRHHHHPPQLAGGQPPRRPCSTH